MKKLNIAILISLPLFLGAYVHAQEQVDISLVQKPEEIKQFIEQKNFELQEQIDQKRLQIKAQIESQKSASSQIEIRIPERVLKIVSKIFDRFEAVLAKFDGILVRIDTRIQKLKEKEIDTAASEQLLVETRNELEQAIIVVSAIRKELQYEIGTTNQISKEQIEVYVETCKAALKKIQTSLIEIILSLKAEGDTEEFSL